MVNKNSISIIGFSIVVSLLCPQLTEAGITDLWRRFMRQFTHSPPDGVKCSPAACTPPGSMYAYDCNDNNLCYQTGRPYTATPFPEGICTPEACTPYNSPVSYTCSEDGSCIQGSQPNDLILKASPTCDPANCGTPGSRHTYSCDKEGKCIQTSSPSDNASEATELCTPERCQIPGSPQKYTCDDGGDCVPLPEGRDVQPDERCSPKTCMKPGKRFVFTCSKGGTCVQTDLLNQPMWENKPLAKWVCNELYCQVALNDHNTKYSCSSDGQCLKNGFTSTGRWGCHPHFCQFALHNTYPGREFMCNYVGECIPIDPSANP